MITLYFTGTGNSLYIAKRIGGELLSIPQMIKEGRNSFKDDVIGIVFPCYYLGLPRIVTEFISNVNVEANYIFGIMTYGSFPGAGINELEKATSKSNINFNYTNEIKMVDNYLPGFKIEDELLKLHKKNIEEHVEGIILDLNSKRFRKSKSPYILKILSTGLRRVSKTNRDDIDKKFIVNDNCTSCGICEKSCPKNNIHINEKPVYHNKCDFCLSCINLCPFNAIHLTNEKSSLRFINPNVNSKEIISSNNQL